MTEDETEKKIVDVEKPETELHPDLKKILKQILDDNYSRGAFIGMVTNIYFNHITEKEPIAVDTIIRQALLIRKQAYHMIEESKTEPSTGADDELEPEKKEVELEI